MRFFSSSRLKTMFLLGVLLFTCAALGTVGHSAFAKPSRNSCSPTPGDNTIVTIAKSICNGKGDPINGWPGKKIVPYVHGGGHNPASPGPDRTFGTQCGKNQTCGVDCSGFTRWVYYLAYGNDVLKNVRGDSSTSAQPSLLIPTPAASAIPGDLVFFSNHVGIYIGDGMIIHAPRTGRNISNDAIKYVGNVLGYYRYGSIPKLVASYTGTAHNTTVNENSNFDLKNIQEDSQGNIRGNTVVSLPLYGSGPFTGNVTLGNTITFTVTAQNASAASTITFTGTVNGPTLSGSYTASDGEKGTWQERAIS